MTPSSSVHNGLCHTESAFTAGCGSGVPPFAKDTEGCSASYFLKILYDINIAQIKASRNIPAIIYASVSFNETPIHTLAQKQRRKIATESKVRNLVVFSTRVLF